jgi:hypothetical protein
MGEISIASEAAMLASLPVAGTVKLFINTDKNNVLYYIDSSGNIRVYSYGETSLEDCCSCEIAKQWMDRVTCALNSGMITATDFGTLINSGLTVSATETTDPDTGAKTCTVNVGPQNQPAQVAVTGLSITVPETAEAALGIGASLQVVATITPPTAPQGIVWVSSDPTIALVTNTGLVVGISAGTATIYAFSAANPSYSDSVNIIVS